MYYATSVTVPANTPRTAPVTTTMELTAGWLSEMRIGFPAGCAGLAGVRVRRFDHQILPLTMGEWLEYDNIFFRCPLWEDLRDEPAEVILELYNDDDTFVHTIAIHAIVEEVNIIAMGAGQVPALR